MRRLARILFALALLWGGARLAVAQEEELVLNFRDTEAAAIVDAIARATGTRIISDPALRARLTITNEDKVSRKEALEILNAALLTIGFAPVPIPGGGYVVLPIESARQSAPWIHRSVSEESSRMVTTLVRLTSANASELAQLLLPGDRAAVIVAYPPTNSLIIAAAEDRIASMLDLLRALDQATASRLEVLPLRWADAGTVATQLDTLFPPPDSGAPLLPLRVNVDPRTNSLIVSGAPRRITEVKKYVDLMDVPKRAKGRVHVVRVLNADAVELAQQLNAISLEETPTRGAGRAGGAIAKLTGTSFSVVADEPTNSLLIHADPLTFGLLADVISELDRIPPRVAIEVSLWSVETTQAVDLGFDALLPLIVPDDAGDVIAFAAFGNPAPLAEQAVTDASRFIARFTRDPLLLPVIAPDGTPTTIVAPGGGAQFTAAQGNLVMRVLSNPYLLAASGEEQHIFAGESVPVPVSGDGAAPSTTGDTTSGGTTSPGFVPSGFVTQQTIQRQDVGVDLRVRPVSLSDHLVSLEIAIDVSAVAPTTIDPSGNLGPTLNQIKIEATVRLADGAVMLLASAPRDTTIQTEEKAPWLGDIPILGWLFKATSDRIVRRRLVAAVQATQLHSPSEERAEQMERALAFQRRALRTQPLRALVTEPYALLVATRDTREAATEILPELSDLDGDALVIEWQEEGGAPPRYDVYLAGFRDIAALGDEAAKLRERGFTPRLEIAGDPE